MLILSAVQWLAFHRAEERVESLPCDTRLAPYRLEVTSFLPPSGILRNAVGHRIGYRGEVEAVVSGKLGGYSGDYEILTWMISSDLNQSVEWLEEGIKEENPDYVLVDFRMVEKSYSALKFAREYGERNITEVVFRPSPPLAWMLAIRDFAFSDKTDPYIQGVIFGPFIGLVLVGAIFLWLVLLAKLQRTNRLLRFLLASILAILILSAAVEGLVYVLGYLMPDEDNGAGSSPSCSKFPDTLHPHYSDFYNMADDYVWENETSASCEVLHYLHSALTSGEFSTLQKTLNVSCS
ncbi:hypothetical protein A3L09_06840 [Thermococcus profundus]|uniref:Uncharacterized protein n=2 Tax=Thermococcus profundus TaxID=49899 RepID=A0A2Z2MBW5_THEPR|nr:hypothetical protein A3L09_06840 [Thermococcus profundus]